MKSIFTFFHHRRRRRLLLLYIDRELPQREWDEMHEHIQGCAECRHKLAEVHACRALVQASKTSPFIPTQQLWQRLTRKTAAASQERFGFGKFLAPVHVRYLRWATVAALVLLLSVAVWKKADRGDGAWPRAAQMAIDYGVFLNDLRQDAQAPRFYKRYPARVVQLAEAQQAIAFPLAAIEALPDSFRLECVRVLECNGKKCIQFTCSKAEKEINIFQHALGQPWTFGKFAVARTPICNVECLLVNAKDFAAVSWQGESSEYLAVGELSPLELVQVVQVLR